MDSSTLLQSLWQVSGDGCRGNSPAECWVFTLLSCFSDSDEELDDKHEPEKGLIQRVS